MTESPTADVTAERRCLCGHSAAAHTFVSSGKCSFCSCQDFDLHIVSGVVLQPVATVPTGLASDAGYIILREMAERLGIAAARLRRAAAKRVVPAVKVARRWAVRPEDVPIIEAHFSSRTASQRAQSASSHDMAARLRRSGRVVSDPVIGELPTVGPAQRATTQAIDLQTDPTAPDHWAVPMVDDSTRDAHAAEQGALANILRPSSAPVPERSV